MLTNHSEIPLWYLCLCCVAVTLKRIGWKRAQLADLLLQLLASLEMVGTLIESALALERTLAL